MGVACGVSCEPSFVGDGSAGDAVSVAVLVGEGDGEGVSVDVGVDASKVQVGGRVLGAGVSGMGTDVAAGGRQPEISPATIINETVTLLIPDPL